MDSKTCSIFDAENDSNIPAPILTSRLKYLCVAPAREKNYSSFAKVFQIYYIMAVFSEEEVGECSKQCYPDLKEAHIWEQFKIYGGQARFLFLDEREAKAANMTFIKRIAGCSVKSLLTAASRLEAADEGSC